MATPRKRPDMTCYKIEVDYEVYSGQDNDRGARIVIKPRLAKWAGFDTYRDEMGYTWSPAQVEKFSDLGRALRAEYEHQKQAREEEIVRVKRFIESRETAYRTILAAVPEASDLKGESKLYPVMQTLLHETGNAREHELKNAARWARVAAAFEAMLASFPEKAPAPAEAAK